MCRASEYRVMKKILIIGVGAGDPGYVTMQAVDALNRTDVFFILDKGPSKTKLIVKTRALSPTSPSIPAAMSS
jgi:precorrin-6A synthase